VDVVARGEVVMTFGAADGRERGGQLEAHGLETFDQSEKARHWYSRWR
jgi:hypothetical protein